MSLLPVLFSSFFFFTDSAPTEFYTLSLHDALPIFRRVAHRDRGIRVSADDPKLPHCDLAPLRTASGPALPGTAARPHRSEEHTSELQSRFDLVCRLLLEKKN